VTEALSLIPVNFPSLHLSDLQHRLHSYKPQNMQFGIAMLTTVRDRSRLLSQLNIHIITSL